MTNIFLYKEKINNLLDLEELDKYKRETLCIQFGKLLGYEECGIYNTQPLVLLNLDEIIEDFNNIYFE
jgi:hypothetical protein